MRRSGGSYGSDAWPMNLFEALRLPLVPRLALVGSGGKTAALFQLARSLPGPVWITTSTHLGREQLARADRQVILDETGRWEMPAAAWVSGVTAICGAAFDGTRAAGLSPERLLEIHTLAGREHIPLLLEADGSRGLPLKAPAEHEPAIPSWAEQVVVVAGLSGLGRPLSGDWVHRAEIFSKLSGIQAGEPVGAEALARVLLHPQGGLKNIPPTAVRSVVLNQADSEEIRALAKTIAGSLIPNYSDVVTASLCKDPALDWSDPSTGQIYSVRSPVAGVILAAGESRRLGRAKQVLAWRGEPMVRHAARLALQAGLAPVVVVTGAYRDAVEQAVSGLPLTCVTNPDWAQGQSTSLQAGLNALPATTRAAVFFLSDQPQLPPGLVQALLDTHARTLAASVAPWVGDRRGNPVLFDRVTFPDLMALRGDTGGRAIFAKYPQEKVAWDDPSILLDVDTEEDYRRLLDLE